jgi:5'-3' exonuclease
MILVDLNQVLLSGLMAQIAKEKKKKYDEDLIRHLILNILRNHIKNFKSEYGQVVLCCDNRNYWRKEIFPFYKAGRKKSREKSDLDWHMIFDILGKIKEELKLNFPYKVIDVDGAEADDIIGTLAPRYVMHENVLILSSDGDFLQLQQYNDKNSKFQIKQYNPTQKKFIKSNNPMMELKEKIIRGDKGDGIPNIYSPSDCFVRDLRQKPITKGGLAKLMNEDSEKWPEETLKIGFSRNKLLIDLREIPKDVKERIIIEYDNVKPAPKSKLFNYFIEKKLKNLMDVIEDY